MTAADTPALDEGELRKLLEALPSTAFAVEGSIYEGMEAEITLRGRGFAQVWKGPNAFQAARYLAAAGSTLPALLASSADKDARIAELERSLFATNESAIELQMKWSGAEASLAAAREEIGKLRGTLEFYADPSLDGYDVHVTNYGLSTEEGRIIKDGGDLARAALGGLPDER